MPRAGSRAHRIMKRTNFAGSLFVVLVTVLVEAGVRLFDLEDSIAAPSATVRALADELSSGALSAEIGTTLAAYAQGFAIAIAGGIVLGVALGSSRTLLHASWLLVEFLRPIPVVAMIPVAILFFGLGLPMRRFVIAYAAFWPILINTMYGVRGSDRLLHDVARTSDVTTVGRLARVTLPSALPSIGTGIRVSASIALLVGVTAEWVTGTEGIGAYMRAQQGAFQLPEMYAAVLLVGVLGYTINVVLRTVERRLVFWVGEERLAPR